MIVRHLKIQLLASRKTMQEQTLQFTLGETPFIFIVNQVYINEVYETQLWYKLCQHIKQKTMHSKGDGMYKWQMWEYETGWCFTMLADPGCAVPKMCCIRSKSVPSASASWESAICSASCKLISKDCIGLMFQASGLVWLHGLYAVSNFR